MSRRALALGVVCLYFKPPIHKLTDGCNKARILGFYELASSLNEDFRTRKFAVRGLPNSRVRFAKIAELASSLGEHCRTREFAGRGLPNSRVRSEDSQTSEFAERRLPNDYRFDCRIPPLRQLLRCSMRETSSLAMAGDGWQWLAMAGDG